MIDNFELLGQYLKFDSDDDFYVLEIIKRRKENPDMETGTQLVHTFCIYNGDLQKKESSIKRICQQSNGRAYLRLNRRSATRVALRALRLTAEYIENGNYKAAKNAYFSAAGTINSEPHKTWLLDVDTKDESILLKVKTILSQSEELVKGDKILRRVLLEVPTVNGWHFITNPFDRSKFDFVKGYGINCVEIHKDNPTLLFF